MKIKSIKIKNFRGYKDETTVNFEDLTVFVGKNDIGKSTILEALDIFFNDNNGVIKIDKDDINIQSQKEDNNTIEISVKFSDVPEKIIIDTTNETSLKNEYLLNSNGELEIVKKYPNAGKAKVFIRANHPTNLECNDLLSKKNTELKKIIESKSIDCESKTTNAKMRKSIWNHFSDNLELDEIEVDITKGDDAKSIWTNLQIYLPLYSLFQSDRKNNDNDSEIQDPLKEAVKQILNEENVKQTLDKIAKDVEEKLKDVSRRTLEKLKEMNSDIANSLSPNIPTTEALKWADVFKSVTISGDENIPIKKRGSGIKRLILLNFFRAEVERKRNSLEKNHIIYAIEEPETSQHTAHQRMLIKAFSDLAKLETTIIITTHSANIVKELNHKNIRLVRKNDNSKTIETIKKGKLSYPSLNEVNYMAFEETSEEYHNELYGFIEEKGELKNFTTGKSLINYTKIYKGKQIPQSITLTEYIRHQIHHPENQINARFTQEQLKQSIELMRCFIDTDIVPL